MSKLTNWPQLLAETIQAAKQRPFLWGETDCCLFAADCALAQTGRDPAASYRGRYKTALGASRLIKTAGGLTAILDSQYARIDPRLAQRGDLALFDGPYGETVGVVFAGIWAPTEQGVSMIDTAPKLMWRVD